MWASNAQDAQEEAEELCADLYEDELLTVIEVDDPVRPYLLEAARSRGAQAAEDNSGLEMSPADACSILNDDATVLGRYPGPRLADTASADGSALRSLADEVGAPMHDAGLLDELVEAWYDGVNQVWSDLLACAAHHTLFEFLDEARARHNNGADKVSLRIGESLEKLEHAARTHPWAPNHR